MATDHQTMSSPIVLAALNQINGANLRGRSRLGSVAGPGVVTWVAFSHQAGNPTTHCANIYTSPTLLADIASNGGTTELEGTPLLPIPLTFRGVKGIPIVSSNNLVLFEVLQEIPSGGHHVYLCHGQVGANNISLGCMLGYQPF